MARPGQLGRASQGPLLEPCPGLEGRARAAGERGGGRLPHARALLSMRERVRAPGGPGSNGTSLLAAEGKCPSCSEPAGLPGGIQ